MDPIDLWLLNHKPAPSMGGGSSGPGNNPPGGAGFGGAQEPPVIAAAVASLATGGVPPPAAPEAPVAPVAPVRTSSYDPTIDYSKLFDFFGLPSDIKQKIQDLIAQSYGDVSQATPLVLAYIRGTDWYAQTYPGIQYGLASGQFGSNPELDYRQYVNQANQYYQQYLQRPVGTDEITNALKEGVDVSILGKRLAGQSYANANSQEWQYELGAFGDTGQTDETGITALGREHVGLTTGLGDKLQAQLDMAHQRMQTIFQGALATPNLSKTSQGKIASNQIPTDIGA